MNEIRINIYLGDCGRLLLEIHGINPSECGYETYPRHLAQGRTQIYHNTGEPMLVGDSERWMMFSMLVASAEVQTNDNFRVVAVAKVRPDDRVIEIGDLRVDPSYRRREIGSELVFALYDGIKQLEEDTGVPFLKIRVVPSTHDNDGFYRKLISAGQERGIKFIRTDKRIIEIE